jgi:hypothetical protein
LQFHKSLIHFGIVGTSIVLASLPAQAAVITYTDRAAFLAALSSSSTDNYRAPRKIIKALDSGMI